MPDTVSRNQGLLAAWLVGRIVIFVSLTSLLGRSLAPSDFGFVALVSILFAIAVEVLDMGTMATATRQISAHPTGEREIIEALLALRRLVAAVVFAAIAALAAGGHFAGGQRAVLVAAGIGVFVLHLGGYQVAINVRGAFRPVVVLGLALQLAFAAATVAALAAGLGAIAIGALIVVMQVAQSVGARGIAVRRMGYVPAPSLVPPRMRALLAAAWMVGVAGICYKVAPHATGLLLWQLAGAESLATFNAAHRLVAPLGEMAWLFVTPLIAPMSVAALRGETALRVPLDGYAKLMLGLGASIAVAGVFCAPTVLRLLYGERYVAGPWSAIEAFRWLALACAAGLVNPVLVVGELARGHARVLLFLGGVGLAGVTAGTLWAASHHGAAAGAAILCALELCLLAVLAGRAAARGELRLDAAWGGYLLPSILLGAILWTLSGSAMAQFAAACIGVPATLLVLGALPAQKASRASMAAAAPDANAKGVPPPA